VGAVRREPRAGRVRRLLRESVDEVEQFAERVRAQGVEAEMHVYPDAPHSFFDRTSGEYQQECDDAWRRILAFVESHAT